MGFTDVRLPGAVAELLAGRRTAVLTGAGISTDSGIPDYRGPHSPRHTPMTIADFKSGPAARQRYWARSHRGWARIRDAQPNAGHLALARLQVGGAVTTIITQNVDGLHDKAGSRPVIDLHGRLDTVVCLDCGTRTSRADLERRLTALNPAFEYDDMFPLAAQPTADASRSAQGEGAAPVDMARPDGDAEVRDTSGFVVAPCEVCGGVLKPDVVFFGENVPHVKVDEASAAVDQADALLVAGSSLTVMSGLRFVKRAAARGVPIVILNHGSTRGDDLATLRWDADCSWALDALASELTVHAGR